MERRWKSGARLAVRPRFLRHGVEEAVSFWLQPRN